MIDVKKHKDISLSGENFVRRILVPHWMEVLTGILVGISIVHLTTK
ncbi:MAG: hypothetical protein ABI340_01570 [Nitrososphaera sp.]|jgi:hypothetical protein